MPFLWETTQEEVVSFLKDKENITLLLGLPFFWQVQVYFYQRTGKHGYPVMTER